MSTDDTIEFVLTDHLGRRTTQASFPGRWSVVFFGFTHCCTVCPRALDRLERALDLLGPDAEAFQPLYITVDPERDDIARMRAYLQSRPAILGLTGSAGELEATRRAFHAFARRTADPEDPDGYAVPHTALTFVLDDAGRRIAHFGDAAPAEEVAGALREIARGAASASRAASPAPAAPAASLIGSADACSCSCS